jgi:AraC-like DNA-binding protein
MALLDPALPYVGRFSSQSELLVFKTRRRSIEARVGKAREVVVRHIKPAEGEPRLLGAYLACLPAQIDHMSFESARMVGEHLLDLIAVALPRSGDMETPKVSSAKSLALLKLRAAIESQLSDPALDPDAVAAAAGISVRYANILLAHEGSSIMRLVLERRLERCRASMKDPKQMHRTLSEIAFGWGFSDMTHFSRRFKTAYGVLPSDYRRRRH